MYHDKESAVYYSVYVNDIFPTGIFHLMTSVRPSEHPLLGANV